MHLLDRVLNLFGRNLITLRWEISLAKVFYVESLNFLKHEEEEKAKVEEEEKAKDGEEGEEVFL